jgi:hypothetical protein
MTADERLAQIGIKIERAKTHIIELDAEISTFLATKPYRILEKVDPKLIYQISHVAPVPGHIGAVVGDIAHNLRSALDHLSHQLMLVALGDQWSNEKSFFPVGDTARRYKAELRGLKEKGFLRQDAFDALLAIEAHKGGKGHQFWVLHSLNNIDKHRIILTAGGSFRSINLGAACFRHLRKLTEMDEAAGTSSMPFSSKDIPILDAFFRPADIMCPLKVGDVLSGGDVEMDLDNDFRFDVALYEPQIIESKAILPTVQQLSDLVASTIALFRPCLS